MILKLDEKTCLGPLQRVGAKKGKIDPKTSYDFFGYGRAGDSGAFSSNIQSAKLTQLSTTACRKKYDVELRENELCFAGDTTGETTVCAGQPNAFAGAQAKGVPF